MDHARGERAYPVFTLEHVPARQQRRRLGTDVSKNNPRQLFRTIGLLPHTFFECALGRLAGHLENPPFHVIQPAMIAAAQPAVFDVAEFERCAAVSAAQSEQNHAAHRSNWATSKTEIGKE